MEWSLTKTAFKKKMRTLLLNLCNLNIIVFCFLITIFPTKNINASQFFRFNAEDCGRSATRTSRIVGGNDAYFGQFPWQVSKPYFYWNPTEFLNQILFSL